MENTSLTQRACNHSPTEQSLSVSVFKQCARSLMVAARKTDADCDRTGPCRDNCSPSERPPSLPRSSPFPQPTRRTTIAVAFSQDGWFCDRPLLIIVLLALLLALVLLLRKMMCGFCFLFTSTIIIMIIVTIARVSCDSRLRVEHTLSHSTARVRGCFLFTFTPRCSLSVRVPVQAVLGLVF